MHDGVVWFDTAGCFAGSYIGKANEAVYYGRFSPAAGGKDGWYIDTTTDPSATNYDDVSRVIADPNTRKPAWDTDVNASGSIRVSDKNLYKDYLKDLIELYEDCDIDC